MLLGVNENAWQVQRHILFPSALFFDLLHLMQLSLNACIHY